MRDAIHDHIAVRYPEYGTPIPLADPIGRRLAYHSRDAEMQRFRREGYSLQTLQQPPRIGLWQGGKLFEDPGRHDQRHTVGVLSLGE
jgi:hypothetical protein